MLKFRIMPEAHLRLTKKPHSVALCLALPLLLGFAPPAHAIRHLTVAQLEKTLASGAAHHRPDDEMMRQFGDFDLTERLTDSTRKRIATTLHLGPQTTLALQLMADESSLLDPPADELLPDPPPNQAAADHMLDAARAYVSKTLPHLPDFLATRTTYTFNDTAQILKVNEWPVHAGLHLVGKNTREVTFRDDQEESGPPGDPGKPVPVKAFTDLREPPHPTERGLQSFGEFGPLLGIIFVDAANGSITFHHWEQIAAGPVAVFHYSIPRSDSHYTVNYCCLSDGLRTSARQGGGRRGGGVTSTQQTPATILYHKIPAYHGSLFIDPATGVVLRVTLEAEMGDGPVTRAATVIEYGSVAIGDRKFVCPLRSMNLYEGPPEFEPTSSELPAGVTPSLVSTGTLYVNETSFTSYHRLGSTVRILPEPEAAAHPETHP